MNRIDTLQIHNFKFFQAQDPIKLNGKHLLLYGENGSGKSSVYWALYTLFEASLKAEDDDIKKYFSKVIKGGKYSLLNIHAGETPSAGSDNYNSFVEVVTDDATPANYKIAVDEVSIRNNTTAKEINYASDYINYRLLMGLSSFRHSDDIDLFEMFVEDIFKYVQFSKVEITRNATKESFTNAFEIWKQIEKGLEIIDSVRSSTPRKILAYKGSELYIEFTELVKSFNESLQKLIDYINLHGPEYFKKLGYDIPYSLHLETEASFNKKGDKAYEEVPFVLRLKIDEYEGLPNPIDKPHSFLNEAKLSALAISIRLAILSQKLKENCLKFVVLDDLLISLDMRNREKVLDLLLSPEFSDNYQLLILSHDKMFFQMAKHKISLLQQPNWVYYEMFETRDGGTAKPLLKRSRTYLEKAQDFFDNNDFEESANNLRKAAEAFCKKILAKTDTITEDYSDLDLNGMLGKCYNYAISNGLDKAKFEELDKHRKFILNASSHDSIDTPKFKNELEECLKLFHTYIDKLQVKNILTTGEKFFFEVNDSSAHVWKFEIELEENFKLFKEPTKPSVLIKGKLKYGVSKDGVPTAAGVQSKFQSIQKMYDDAFASSDKATNPDFWEVVKFTSNSSLLKTIRTF
jgi:hypothetical protein